MKADVSTVLAGNYRTWDCWPAEHDILEVLLLVYSGVGIKKGKLLITAPCARSKCATLRKLVFDALSKVTHGLFSEANVKVHSRA